MPLGIYISVPFCRSKCSYCNFASGVFSMAVHEHYIDRVCRDIENAYATVSGYSVVMDRAVDSIFMGGGTPTVLDITQLERLFIAIESNFYLQEDAEITVECAPGSISPDVLELFRRCGVNRVSLGVQSFIDQEAAAVGRIHKPATVIEDISRLRAAGISNINIDLIAGLPHQTYESWNASLDHVIATGVPHVSVYMLEVDEDSRLGREVIAGGKRYHAHFVPDDDLVADFYESACEKLDRGGVKQYEISNFCREGCESRHNLKYWTRQPYFGFGLDAHSMLSASGDRRATEGGAVSSYALRFCTADSMERYMSGCPLAFTPVSPQAALEEAFFLGLRLNAGVNLNAIEKGFGARALGELSSVIEDCAGDGLIEKKNQVIRLTARGRLLSNEVFQRFMALSSNISKE